MLSSRSVNVDRPTCLKTLDTQVFNNGVRGSVLAKEMALRKRTTDGVACDGWVAEMWSFGNWRATDDIDARWVQGWIYTRPRKLTNPSEGVRTAEVMRRPRASAVAISSLAISRSFRESSPPYKVSLAKDSCGDRPRNLYVIYVTTALLVVLRPLVTGDPDNTPNPGK